MRSEESYSYKTSSSKLVQVAEIASRYKGRPEMLMKVIIQVQRIVPAFPPQWLGDRQGNGESHRRTCTALLPFTPCFP